MGGALGRGVQHGRRQGRGGRLRVPDGGADPLDRHGRGARTMATVPARPRCPRAAHEHHERCPAYPQSVRDEGARRRPPGSPFSPVPGAHRQVSDRSGLWSRPLWRASFHRSTMFADGGRCAGRGFGWSAACPGSKRPPRLVNVRSARCGRADLAACAAFSRHGAHVVVDGPQVPERSMRRGTGSTFADRRTTAYCAQVAHCDLPRAPRGPQAPRAGAARRHHATRTRGAMADP